ncbi:MAG: zinc dependent phospholipase C family protein [Acidobacteriaceae bacterium]
MRKSAAILAVILLVLAAPAGRAYSVLSHEETVDMAWNNHIVPLLLQRYPSATPDDLRLAHSYAYGGCILQDLGYYPFGNRYFSDLLHYVRTGDFVGNLLKDSQNLNEYAFALGAMAHYIGDTTGHPAIGRATAREYPKLRRRYGSFVSYYDSPKAHIRTEFGFDVVQVAQGHYVADDYHNFIGFNVAQGLLERAFQQTYGIDLHSVLKHEDLAINSYRYSISTLIPEMTRAAVVDYAKQIQQQVPTLDRKKFVYRIKRADYEREWGKKYHRPGVGAHLIAFLLHILPNRGPFTALKLQLPNAQDQKTYLDSMQATVNKYERDLDQLRAQPAADPTLPLPNLDFDTGKQSALGEYPLADDTYARLLNTLAHQKDAEISNSLQSNVLLYYAHLTRPRRSVRYVVFQSRRQRRLEKNLALLRRQKSSSTLNIGSAPPAARAIEQAKPVAFNPQ